ncbi:hypothetical protein AgCh_003972 [Apium graveolens]
MAGRKDPIREMEESFARFRMKEEEGAKTDKLEWNQVQLGYEGLFVVDPVRRRNGLALFWKEKDQENLLGFSQSHIDVEVMVEGMQKWRLTGVYGEPNRSLKKKIWDLLRHLARD